MSTIGNNILRKRKELGMTQEELADRMGYKSKSSINKIELGINDVPRSKIEKFAEVLGTTPARLMGLQSLKLGAKISHNIAHNIQYHREESNLSQKQFADLLGVDEKTVIDLENGQKKLDKEMLYKICDVLVLIPGNIIPRDDEEFSEDEEYLYSRRQNFPNQLKLTEDERTLLELFRQIPADQRQLVLQMIRAAIGHI